MSAEYRERVWLNWWVWTIIIIVAVASMTALLGRGNFGYVFERPPAPLLYVFLFLAVIFVFTALNFRKVEILVDRKHVTVSYGILKKTTRVDDIASCEVAKMKTPLYGGVGPRLAQDDLPGFTAGNAVKIITKAGKTFKIPTNKPKELAKSLNLCRS